MAVSKIKTTYSLDPATVRELDDMARRWKVSKSEALRRAIRAAAQAALPGAKATLEALDDLQRSLALDAKDAARWERRVRARRKDSAWRREAHGA